MEILVSVIVPLYFGKKHIDFLCDQFDRAFRCANITDRAEAIFVNDSPDELITIPETSFKTVLVKNDVNRGIHFSRVNGLSIAEGKYIHFIDQDDVISPLFYKSQLETIKKADVCIANCKLELSATGKEYKYLYKNRIEYLLARVPLAYIILDNRIFSPGQCLIKKDSIPEYWKQAIMQNNGVDDYYLWMLMFESKASFVTNKHVAFLHKYTGQNWSLKDTIMLGSLQEMEQLLAESPYKKYYRLFKSKISYLTGEDSDLSFLFKWIMSLRQLRIRKMHVKVYK